MASFTGPLCFPCRTRCVLSLPGRAQAPHRSFIFLRNTHGLSAEAGPYHQQGLERLKHKKKQQQAIENSSGAGTMLILVAAIVARSYKQLPHCA